ncbi:hypothetical protein F4809DRAFT_239335 [Biscogniauxia mediterranea]|nr:hypothetical protein F4809DRAFT_239335 [Biscogniauxia mediterranea]
MGGIRYAAAPSDTSKDTDDRTDWDEEQHVGLYSNVVKPTRAIAGGGGRGGGEQSWAAQALQRLSYHGRRHDLRRLLVLLLVVASLLIVLFQASRREFYSIAPSRDPEQPEAAPKAPLGECTTWPVPVGGSGGGGNATYRFRQVARNSTLQSFAPKGGWKKPEGVGIKALIFYGRRRTVDFLDCYLSQNLVDNGGYLDEVWFMIHTDNQDDLAYLDRLVARRERYRIVNPGECQGSSYGCIWDPVVEDDTIYIKIDDDIVFIHPDTIPQLVHTRLKEPHPYAVSANLVNSPLTGYKHYDAGAIHPFRPDPHDAPRHRASETWRPSERREFPLSELPGLDGNASSVTEAVLAEHVDGAPPYEGHPWLLVAGGSSARLPQTPMGINRARLERDGEEAVMGAAWRSWMIAAQQHYSLLQNLEDDAMWRYHFGAAIEPGYPRSGEAALAHETALRHAELHGLGPGAEQLLDTAYVRYNLNFVALWGHDVRAALPIAEDDEQDITVTIPTRMQRPFVIDTRAVIAHLGFNPQQDGVRQTDLLDRWRAFANEMVCAPGDRKKPFDERCPGF